MKRICHIAAGLLFVLGTSAQTIKVHKNDGTVVNYNSNMVSHIDFSERTRGEAVDLGLSVMWAECNIGASSPEEYGTYFRWDGTDYARSKLGGTWRMPTYAECQELIDNCTFQWSSRGGVTGCYFIASNGNSIFLPASGFMRLGSEPVGIGTEGNYWTITQTGSNYAYDLQFYSDGPFMDSGGYTPGAQTIRPVCEHTSSYGMEKEPVIVIHMKSGQTIVHEGSDVDYINFTTSASDETFDYEAVDLGLPSGTLWAKCNVGANTPTEYGDYFAWGETKPKTTYTWDTYIFGSNPTKYNYVDNIMTLEATDDAATMNWGDIWRMPTIDEMNELMDNCTWEWTTLDHVNGYKVVGANGNSIFLPAAGYRNETLNAAGIKGHYWTSTLIPIYAAKNLASNANGYMSDWSHRLWGLTVRPVMAKKDVMCPDSHHP
mgnify:CR=1 FL=1